MYNDLSLVKRLVDVGFQDVKTLPPGKTSIPDPGGLDLFERNGDSLYVEARQP